MCEKQLNVDNHVNYGDFGVVTPITCMIEHQMQQNGINAIDLMHSMWFLIDCASNHVESMTMAINAQNKVDCGEYGPNVGGHHNIMVKQVEQCAKLIELIKTWQNMDWEM